MSPHAYLLLSNLLFNAMAFQNLRHPTYLLYSHFTTYNGLLITINETAVLQLPNTQLKV